MNAAEILQLESILIFPGSRSIVSDASVLTCGCLVSESLFVQQGTKTCPTCFHSSEILKLVDPLRRLASVIEYFKENQISKAKGSSSALSIGSKDTLLQAATEPNDLLELFYKYAREENSHFTEKERKPPNKLDHTKLATSDSQNTKTLAEHTAKLSALLNYSTPTAQYQSYEKQLILSLSEREEINFSRCFPFHRKLSQFPIQNNKLGKLSFRTRSIRPTRFTGSSLCTWSDSKTGEEQTTYVLITEKRWELYKYSIAYDKPLLVASGKLTGEISANNDSFESPHDKGLFVRNDFGTNPFDEETLDGKLKSWLQLSCKLSRKFIAIAGTKGMLRVLNADASIAPIGTPIYTYVTNFPIRCVEIAPNDELVACGITARERISGKQQPFIVLHQLEKDLLGSLCKVNPITITIPYRDPLKSLSFNATSNHIVCCTVYEMRYFVIRLDSSTRSLKKPRLIWSDLRLPTKKQVSGTEGYTDERELAYQETPDDNMMDYEGITSVSFGRPGTNTVIITSSTMKTKPPLVVKLKGPQLDQPGSWQSTEEFYSSAGLGLSSTVDDEPVRSSSISDAEIIYRIPEIGSWIHGCARSPRGDSFLFVEKSGKLYLVSPANANMHPRQKKNVVVVLGEAAGAQRCNEAASVQFSTDGGKIFVVDRKGLFQIFDFCKGIPGEDPDVIKCKIINV